jgi:hypothetical protein
LENNMKNLKQIFGIIILSAGLGTCAISSAHEGWHHGGGHYVWRPGFGWVVPAVIGGAIVYEATRPVQPNVVVVQPQPVAPAPAPAVTTPPAGFHWEAILDASCNCYKTVAVPN